MYAFGHVPRKPDDPDRIPDRRLLGGAVLALLMGIGLWSLLNNGLIPFWRRPLTLFTPHDWWGDGPPTRPGTVADNFYDMLWMGGIAYYFGKLGNWPEVVRRYLTTPGQRALASLAAGFVVWLLNWTKYVPIQDTLLLFLPPSWVGFGGAGTAESAAAVVYTLDALVALLIAWPFAKYGRWTDFLLGRSRPGVRVPGPQQSHSGYGVGAPQALATPADWPELRDAGRHAVADRLAREVAAGSMNDVDCVRIRHAWQVVGGQRNAADEFADTVLREGGAACVHPSGERDVPQRVAAHDLLARQVRIGRGVDDRRNPYQHRGSGIALEPPLLATGLLVVGPAGVGKTRRVIRPVAESLCLQALTGQSAVVAVCAAGTDLGPAEAYDVVIAPGDPTSRYDLDIYGGTTDPDTAAWVLAEALTEGSETEQRRAVTALSQILAPFAAAYGRFPSVPELRELLDGVDHAFGALRAAVDAVGAPGLVRELAARERQAARPGDIGGLLAERIAVLDRPAFAGFFDVTGRNRPFSMEALAHPLRVRIDLPQRAHAEASRILTRLILAQYMNTVTGHRERPHFVCLILDDAGHAVTTSAVRALPQLRSANAGVVFGLRSLEALPEEVRGPLVGTSGCRMVLGGVTSWDGRYFAEAWGTVRTETRDITRTPDQSGGNLRRLSRGVRKVFTGEAVTTESVTVREVERERWSASDLANSVPAGHAVVSFTTTAGESAPPVLVDLRG
ncbi:hypothetical protein [Streptomyces sp. NRRL F-5123]|uniref:hypothetical protein n=1 Tax=Streptomyces sp. NRRL F-5123 TaxID=1463856 RepID=UPI0006936559|nr:hypothetical protein [Streptomyces sp. NRRL F-5123]